MKRFLITLTFIASAIGAIEASKALWSWRSALKEVDQLYVVSTNQHAVCLGASCIGCSIVGDRFKSLWVPSSFEGISVRAPLARLMELERRGQLKGVSYCIMESCLFSIGLKVIWLIRSLCMAFSQSCSRRSLCLWFAVALKSREDMSASWSLARAGRSQYESAERQAQG